MTLTRADTIRLEEAGFLDFSVVNRNGDVELINRDGRCLFLDGADCRVYNVRPDGCRLYPLVLDLGSGRVVLDEICPHREEFSINDDRAAELRRSVSQERFEALRRRRTRS